MKKINFDKYFYLGIYFIIIQIFVLIKNYFFMGNYSILYYCDHIAFLFAIAFFMRKINWVKAFISIGFLIQSFYLIDLVACYGFGIELVVFTNYLSNIHLFPAIISLVMHLGTSFVALAFVYKEKNSNISLVYALAWLSLLYVISLVFAPPGIDLNCVYHACGMTYLYFPGFTKLWIFVAFVLFILPVHYMQVLLYYFSKRNKKKN